MKGNNCSELNRGEIKGLENRIEGKRGKEPRAINDQEKLKVGGEHVM